MSIVVGLCVTSSFHIVAASMSRKSAFIVGIIIELYVIYLLNRCSKCLIKDNQQLYQRRQCLPISPQI
jgi:hypothetical protein